jgi:hypothetical protein
MNSDDGPTGNIANELEAREAILDNYEQLLVVVAEALKRLFIQQNAECNAAIGDVCPVKLPAEAYSHTAVYEQWYADGGFADEASKRKATELATAFAEFLDIHIDFNLVTDNDLSALFGSLCEIVEGIADSLFQPDMDLTPPAREIMKQLLVRGAFAIDLSEAYNDEWFEEYLE